MAQPGDTITYAYNGGGTPDQVRQSEDISDIARITIEYIDAAGGEGGDNNGSTSGGRVENVDVDVSDEDTLYIWVSTQPEGRYGGGRTSFSFLGGGSTEVAFIPTVREDSDDEPFIAGAGGGGGGASTGFFGKGGSGGARGGGGAANAVGTPPPQGGDGAPRDGSGTAGDGAVENRAEILDAGTTIKGGGSAPDTDGEVKITYKEGLSAPDPPSNLTAEVQ